MKAQFSILYVVITSLFLLACREKTQIENSPIEEDPCNKGISIHAISDSLTSVYTANYQKYIDSVMSSLRKVQFPDPGRYLTYGAKVDLFELREVLSQSRCGDQLYLMLGIKPSDSNPKVDSTEIFFILDKTERLRKDEFAMGDEGEIEGFDFTYPCPNSCPP